VRTLAFNLPDRVRRLFQIFLIYPQDDGNGLAFGSEDEILFSCQFAAYVIAELHRTHKFH
jgi:hypothetical protein